MEDSLEMGKRNKKWLKKGRMQVAPTNHKMMLVEFYVDMNQPHSQQRNIIYQHSELFVFKCLP